MDKIKHFIGIDISKDTFDVWIQEQGHHKFENSLKGFKAFKKVLPPDSYCVMEATGSYYQQLAGFLYSNEVGVSVVNPLVIKRYMQMKLQHNKTDKSDARMIASYATEQKLKPWMPEPEYIQQCKLINSCIELYLKQSTALKNKVHSIQSTGISAGKSLQSLKRQIKQIQLEIKKLEQQLEELIRQYDSELLTNLISIPGVGKKTALLLIAHTNSFRYFDKAKQVSAFFGLAPAKSTSGTTINGRPRITKKGNTKVRNHLFLCSFSACKLNPQCKALYTRLVNKGKSKKLALIGVCNKLIAQSFAIAKSNIPYDPEYKSVLCVE